MRAPCSQAGALHSQPPTPGHRAAVGDAKTMRRSQWKRQPFQMAQAATTALSSALSLVSVAGGQGRPRPEKPVSLIHQSRVTISRRDQYLTAPELWAMGYRRCAGTGAEASHQSRERKVFDKTRLYCECQRASARRVTWHCELRADCFGCDWSFRCCGLAGVGGHVVVDVSVRGASRTQSHCQPDM
jgi:hypothetical protein